MLYTLNLHDVICQLYLNTTGGKKAVDGSELLLEGKGKTPVNLSYCPNVVCIYMCVCIYIYIYIYIYILEFLQNFNGIQMSNFRSQ